MAYVTSSAVGCVAGKQKVTIVANPSRTARHSPVPAMQASRIDVVMDAVKPYANPALHVIPVHAVGGAIFIIVLAWAWKIRSSNRAIARLDSTLHHPNVVG